MKIGSIGNAPVQPASNSQSQVVDTKSKELQAQITNAQNKLQQISSNPNMSDEEKSRLRQEIQKQISELNNQLRKHQLEVRQKQQQAREADNSSKDTRQAEASGQTEDTERRTQDRGRTEDTRMQDTRKAQDDRRALEARRVQDERRADAVRAQNERRADAMRAQESSRIQAARQAQDTRRTDDAAPVQDVRQTQSTRSADDVYADRIQTEDDRNKTTDISAEEIRAVVSADTAVKHAASQGQVSAGLSNKARVIEGEIRQDTRSSRDVKSRQSELEIVEQRAAAASNAQMSILSDASGEVRKVNVKDNAGRVPTNYNKANQARVTEKPAKIATGFSPDNTVNKNMVDAYSKGKAFSSVKFSF